MELKELESALEGVLFAAGEPVAVELPELDARALAERLWASLDEGNRVSLYVCVDGEEAMINKYGEETK